ncbi:MAG: hypothetical protein Q8N99_07090 [Nanoarchaeota archaeon]|nr:hypothetical protein [Nanoarchaeota archaeon]
MDWETFRDEELKRLLTCYPYECVKRSYPEEYKRGLRISILEAYSRLTHAGLAEKLTLQEAEPIWEMIGTIFNSGCVATRDWIGGTARNVLENIDTRYLHNARIEMFLRGLAR